MKNNDKKKRFVRINGRIVPIGGDRSNRNKGFSSQKRTALKKKKQEQATKSALFTISGLGTSIGAGIFASRNKRRAKLGQQTAFDFINDGIAPPKKIQKKAIDALNKRSRQFTLGGQLLGGALLSQGIQRALKSAGVENDSLALDIGAETGSQAAAELITRSFRKGQGGKVFEGSKRAEAARLARLTKQTTQNIVKRLLSRQLRFKI